METGQEFLAIDYASAFCASIFAVGVICEFSRRSTVRRTFRAAATLAAGGESADFRVTLLAGFDPFAVVRRRDRHHVSGAKSDVGDAKLLADLVRTDRHNHRQLSGDSAQAEAIKVLARGHQNLIWARTRLRSQAARAETDWSVRAPGYCRPSA